MKIGIGNSIFIIGGILILIGLVYQLGYTSSIYFKYSFAIGFMLFGMGILIDGIEKRRRKRTYSYIRQTQGLFKNSRRTYQMK